MKPLTLEWIKKAEGDYSTALREVRARKFPNYDAACFHSQQCVEKLMKAILQESNIPFEKTHNLITLLTILSKILPEVEILRPSLKALNAFSVQFRYPGESAD